MAIKAIEDGRPGQRKRVLTPLISDTLTCSREKRFMLFRNRLRVLALIVPPLTVA